jgi:putative N6-adenine-specific DNA methylase
MLHEISALIAAPITLIDPMAGSGTFSLEAAYIASGLIPGVCRDFALKHQPAFKPATWNHIVTPQGNASPSVTPKREAQVCPLAAIATTDISERAISIIRHNVECSPLASAPQGRNAPAIAPQVKDFFTYTAEEIACACPAGSQPAMVLNPPYGKRLDFDAPKLYTRIGKKLAELARDLNNAGKPLTVAILSPKDDTRNGAKYTCTANLLQACPALDPARNPQAKKIITSHGGITLNVFIATL